MIESEIIVSESNSNLEPIKLDFIKEKNRYCVSYYDKENVVSLLISESGWSHPKLFHCIFEWGEYGDYNHCLLTKEEIEEKYNIKICINQ